MDTVQQAIENFKRFGFVNVDYITEGDCIEIHRLPLAPFELTNKTEEFVMALKPSEYDEGSSGCFARCLIINGLFLPKRDSTYILSTNSSYSPSINLQGLALKARGDSSFGKINDNPKIARHAARESQIQGTIRRALSECLEDLGVDKDVKLMEEYIVSLKLGFYIQGQDFPAMIEKFEKALKGVYS